MYAYLTDMGGASTSDAGASNAGMRGPSPFQGSREWFDRFKKLYDLRNVKLSGERASVDHEAAKTFPARLTQLNQEKGYLPEQVFNADETFLFWKKMPTRTFMSKHEGTASGIKATKDRISLFSSTQMQKGTG